MTPQWPDSGTFVYNIVVSAIILAVFFVIRWVAMQMFRDAKWKITSTQRKRHMEHSSNILFFLLLIALIYAWADTIQVMAVSIFAVSLAIVISVKELLVCLHGSFIRMRSKSYDIGDRIEISGIRGDVVEVNFLSTTIAEAGQGLIGQQHTGRRVTFANSMLLEHSVTNSSFLDNFLLHNIIIPMEITGDWRKAREILLRIAQKECEPFLMQIKKEKRSAERRRGIDLPSIEPQVSIIIPEPRQINLLLHMPTPSHLKGSMEQKVLTQFLDEFPMQSFMSAKKELKDVKVPTEPKEIAAKTKKDIFE